jgi:SAM-dependent methyltransferase
MNHTVTEDKQSVREYWERMPCGSSLTSAEPGSKEFFDEIEQERYKLEPFIPGFAEFDRWRAKRVLEIGVGVGTDFIRFARAGAKLSGIDLTDASVELVRRRLALEGLTAELRVADAEALPFADETFDLVFCWGVLHHTPDTRRALAEVRRVLALGGEARIMLYSRHSWFALGVWIRHALLKGRPWRSFSEVLADHVESPGTKAFSGSEIRTLFEEFRGLTLTRWVTPYDRRVGGPLVQIVGRRLGWFIGIRGVR